MMDIYEKAVLEDENESLDKKTLPQSVSSLQEIGSLVGENYNPKEYSNSYEVISPMMYLIGVDKIRFLEHRPSLEDRYNEYERNDAARAIRALCEIRTALMKHYGKIKKAFLYDLKNLSTIPEYVPAEAVQEINRQGINIENIRPHATKYLIAANTEILNRVGSVKGLFPDWIKWEYIRSLFIMPKGTNEDGVKDACGQYWENKYSYPFQCYLNWNGAMVGNILRTDYKFVTELYAMNHDEFEDKRLIQATEFHAEDGLHSFLENHERVLVAVDCENSDPVRLAATFASLDNGQKDSIQRVMFFDSDYTTPAWKTLCNAGIMKSLGENRVSHVIVPRVVEHKSQVDMTLAINVSREIYKEGADSVMVVSSDSDYWALMQSFPDIDFLVLVEREKTGTALKKTLESGGIRYCYIDDFCTGSVYQVKVQTVLAAIQKKIDEIVDFNVKKMLDDELDATWLSMTDKEKANLYNLHLKKMRLSVADDGEVRVALG